MKKFFNKRSKKVVDNAIKALVFLQKPFAMFGLFLILMGAFFAPAVSAYNVWSNSEKMISQIEETKSLETLPTQLYDDIDASMIPISKEIENLREENQKVFLKKDGTYEVSIYQDPVHYKSNDQYIDIDNTLVDDGKYYTNKQNAFNIYFPKSLNQNESIKIKAENYQIQWKIINSKQSKANQSKQKKKDKDLTILNHLSSEIKYQKVFENTDLEYVLKSNQIKENLYLSQYNENIVYSFEYELKNLTIEKKEDSYFFINDLQEEIFHLDNLYMIDSQGEISYEVKIGVERKAHNKYIIKIIPDDTFLKTASYPVKIDPTLILSRQTPVVEDTYVSENHKTTNYSNQSIMKVGYEKAVTTRKDILIKFSIPSFIKSSDVITYSHLNLSRVDKVSSNHQINVYRNITNYTNSTVNWNTKPLYNKEIIDYYDFRYVDTPLVFDISRPTKEWHENGSNFGLTIAPESHHNSVINIYQSQASYEVRPVVRIGYETKGGLKNYWTYTSQELGQAGTGYVSDFTGNLVFKRDEYFVQNEYLPLNLSFYHNGINGYSTIGYGYGYKTNYNYIILYDSNLNQYYLDTPDGNKVYFSLFSSDQSEYPYQWDYSIAEDGSRWELYQEFYNGQLTYATISTPEQIKYEFNAQGKLITIRNNANYHSISITYLNEDRISLLKDSVGNQIVFTYNNNQLSQTELKLIQPNGSYKTVEKRVYNYSLTMLNSVVVYMNYDKTSNVLKQMSTLYYSYQTGRLTTAYSSIDNYKVIYTHNLSGKVTNITLEDDREVLSKIRINHSFLETTYTNHKNEWVTYYFDNYGHTINVIDSNVNASYYRYANPFSYINIHSNLNGYDLIDQAPNYYINHKIIESSDVIKQTHNYISNHGFENINGLAPWHVGNGSSEIKATDETRLLGDKSLKILNQAANSSVNQNIYLKKGSYRLSVWVKNESSIGKAKVSVTSNSLSSHVLSQKTGQWEKITLDFMLTNQETVKISLENLILNTTTYFDNVELSEGFIDTRYNVLANHSFEEGFSNWETRGASSASNTVPNQTGAVFGETHLKIVGDSFENRYARQVVTNFLTEGETYMVGAWAKANAAPSSATGGLNKNRFFGLEIHITKENDDDSIGTVSYYLPFNASIKEWQYQMTAIEIPYKTLEVTVALRYQGTGEALFDNVQLYHDDLKTAYSYNLSNGNLLEKQSAGKVTSYTYDYNYRVTSVTENNQKLNIGYQYNNISQLSLNNVKASYTYTSKNQVKETILGDQSKEWFKTSVGYTTDFQYINESMDEFGNKTKYQVNHLTGLIDMIENAKQDKTYFTYDSFGNLIKQEEIENLTNAKIIKDMTYDEVYRLKSISIDGVTYEFGYDQLDRVTNIKIAGIDYLTLSYLEDIHMLEKYQTYKLGSQAYGNNDTYYFTYDKQDNISKISLNHIDLYEYIYDQKNRLTMYKDLRSNDIYFYSYDLANRLEQIVDQNDNKVIYEYDGLGNIRSSDYRYQGVNRKVYYIYNQFTGEYEYTYYQVSNQEIRKEYQIDQNDALRRIKKINLIVGTSLNLSQEMSYLNPGTNLGNTSLLIDKITYKQNNLTNDTHQFKYDQLGNIIEIKITGRSNELYNYTYDGFGRLIREDIYLEGYERTLTYTYDQRGNITSIKTYLYGKITEKPLKETKISYHQGAWKDQISEISYFMNGELIKTDVYTYDQIGNVISITENQLTNLAEPVEKEVRIDHSFETPEALALNLGYNPNHWESNSDGWMYYVMPIQYAYPGDFAETSVYIPPNTVELQYRFDEYNRITNKYVDTGWLTDYDLTYFGHYPLYIEVYGEERYQDFEINRDIRGWASQSSDWLKIRIKTAERPEISGLNTVLNNIDSPYTIDQLKQIADIKAYDVYDGDISDKLVVISDSYTKNKNQLGIYELTFRVKNSVGLCDEFRLNIENKKLTHPTIIGPNSSTKKLIEGFNINEFLSLFSATNNMNQNLEIELVNSNYKSNLTGNYELVLRSKDDYGDETYFIHNLEIYENQPKSETSTQEFYWEGRRLVSQVIGDITYQYTYNDQGIRTSKTINNILTEYFLEGMNVLSEKTGDSIIYYTYDVNGELISMNYLGNEYFYVKNIQGDILEIVNQNGITVAKYRYDAWGNIIYQYDDGSNLSNINPYRYRGYRYDKETGLYYLNTRYYDPSIGRFISADSISYLDPRSTSGLNLYAYCNNNPVMYLDSEGNYPVHIFNNSSTLFRFKLISSSLNFRNQIIAFDYNGNHRNPNYGIPGSKSKIFYPDGSLKQERVYGPDGRPLKDHDYHDGEDVGYEHDHDWDWNKKPPRGPAQAPDTSKIIGQVATTTVIVIGAYYIIKWGRSYTCSSNWRRQFSNCRSNSVIYIREENKMNGLILKCTGITKNIIKELLKDIDILDLEFDIQYWESYGDDMEGANFDFNNTSEISSEIIKNKLFIENNTLYPEFMELFARKENDSKTEIFNYKDFLESKYIFSIVNYDYRNIEVCSKIPGILESIKKNFLNSDLKDKKIIELDHIPEDATLKSWRQGKGING